MTFALLAANLDRMEATTGGYRFRRDQARDDLSQRRTGQDREARKLNSGPQPARASHAGLRTRPLYVRLI